MQESLKLRLESALACTQCRGKLSKSGDLYRCGMCKKEFRIRDGSIFFVSTPGGRMRQPDDIVYRLKQYFKKHHPRFFIFLYTLVSIPVGTSARSVAAAMPDGSLMVNVGSGVKGIDGRVINLDYAPEPGVDIVASAYELPFQDGSVDLILSESLLEHLEHPEMAVKEMHRVVKRGGRVYILTPFLYGFHSSPNDFFRWTIPGMKILLGDFIMQDAGVAVGPTAAMAAIVREWLAILLSFNSRFLYQLFTLFFMILFIPLGIIDYLIARYGVASQIALAYYFIAEKR